MRGTNCTPPKIQLGVACTHTLDVLFHICTIRKDLHNVGNRKIVFLFLLVPNNADTLVFKDFYDGFIRHNSTKLQHNTHFVGITGNESKDVVADLVTPVKQWLASIGAQRIDQMIDPEQTFQMAVEDYRRQGYSDKWINARMRSIEMRKELTDEWQRAGVHEQKDFAILTNILTKAWSGMTTREYKRHKGLTKENLRDNMTNVELALNTLAEVATTELSRQSNPQGIAQTSKTAQAGGEVARNARTDLENKLGRSVISAQRASDYIHPIEDTNTRELPSGKDK